MPTAETGVILGTCTVTQGVNTVVVDSVSDGLGEDLLARGVIDGDTIFLDGDNAPIRQASAGALQPLTLHIGWPGDSVGPVPFAIIRSGSAARLTASHASVDALIALMNTGAVLTPHATDVFANRSLYDDKGHGFRFYAEDTDARYVRQGETPGVWAGPYLNSGPRGEHGGAVTLRFTADTTTGADSDPGVGKFRFSDPANQNASGVWRFDDQDLNGPVRATLATFIGNTSSRKVRATVSKVGAPEDFVRASATLVAQPTGYTNVTVTIDQASEANPIANGDEIIVRFTDVGDKGDQGDQGEQGIQGDPGSDGSDGSDGADGTDPGILLTADVDTADADQGAGKIWADAADLSAASFLYVSDENRNGSAIAAALLAMDDSTNPGRKAEVLLTRTSDGKQARFALAAVTSGDVYKKLAVSGFSGTTDLLQTADAPISLQVSPVGDQGIGATHPLIMHAAFGGL